jgi:hypothetical protein
MNAFNYIKNHIFVKLKPSSIAGIGVFSLKDIPADTFLFKEWEGETGFYPISQTQLNELDFEIRNHIKDIFIYSINFPKDTNIYIKLTNGCHWIYPNPYYFINSGYYQNKSNVDKDTMKSLRFIKSGEELFSNYPRCEKMEAPNII